jgi:dihydroorotase
MIEPERSFTIEASKLRSKSSNTPFLGHEVTGMVALTMSEGAVIFDTTEDV